MPREELRIRDDLVVPAHELVEQTSTSGGPGGQHANKTSTRVTLRWSVRNSGVLSDHRRRVLLNKLASRLTNDGELVIHADGTRSQFDNRAEARERMAQIVKDALVVQKRRRKTKPTRASKRRRVDAKTRRGKIKKNRGKVSEE